MKPVELKWIVYAMSGGRQMLYSGTTNRKYNVP